MNQNETAQTNAADGPNAAVQPIAIQADVLTVADNAASLEAGTPHESETDEAILATEAIDTAEAKRVLEAALLAAAEPMHLNELRRLFEGQLSQEVIRNLLDEVRAEWAERSVELAVVASGYRFRVRPAYQKYIERLSSDKPLKYSRAVLETLAIIAYRQPVTRGDIEDIRGVAVSPHILKTLEDRGWIDEIGHRETVGRPVLFATTKHFLDDLNLRSLDELPPLHELQATLDMTQAGALLSAMERAPATLDLPGVAALVSTDPASAAPQLSTTVDDENDSATPDGVSTVDEPLHSNSRQAS